MWKKITQAVDWLGISKPVDKDAQSKSIYAAEGQLHDSVRKVDGWLQSDAEASKELRLGEARELATKIIHHPSLDSIPGIAEVRKSFDPATDIVFTKKLMWKDQDGKTQMPGAMVTTEQSWSGKPNRLLLNKYLSPNKKVKAGGLTHELAHMITNPEVHGHNWAMARTHLAIAKILSEESAENLKSHYDTHSVDYGGSL